MSFALVKQLLRGREAKENKYFIFFVPLEFNNVEF